MSVAHRPILVAQSHPADVRIINDALRRAQLTNPVKSCATGTELIQCLEAETQLGSLGSRPAFAFLDLELADASVATLWIQAHSSSVLRGVRIVIAAKRFSLSIVKEARKSGIHCFLLRPLEVREVLRLVRPLNSFLPRRRVDERRYQADLN